MTPLVIVAPMPPRLTNGSHGHWRGKHARKVAYWRMLDSLEHAGVIPPPPPTPFEHVRIASVMHLGAAMDDDNAMARHKWLVDWLRTRRYIADDRKHNVTWAGLPEQRIKRRKGKDYVIELTITERMEEAA